MIIRMFFILFFIVLVIHTDALGGNFGFGVHSGYGVLKFKEMENFFGNNLESESKQNVILFGGSGEYSFQKPENFYISITTDWALGFKDRETWRQDNVQVQTNDFKVFGQFYDLRFGYKNRLNNFYYRIYLSGGWDGLHFKRDNIIWRGTPLADSISEDIGLWRAGAGAGFGYNPGKWALDGRVAYSYYPEGETEDSSLSQYTFDAKGTCLDMGVGVSREVAKNTRFYLGGSYTLQKLKGGTTGQAISWKSKLEILVGTVNVTYAF